MNIFFKPLSQFGQVNLVGVHQVIESESDVDNAIYNAERDNFERIFLYCSDLKYVQYAREIIEQNEVA